MFLALSLFFCMRSLRYLRYFQQEEYNGKRFGHWWWKNRAFDKRGTLALLLSPLLLIPIALLEENPLRTGKLKLRLTARAKRIWAVSWIWFAATAYFVPWIVIPQLIPLFLVAANSILKPYEAWVQRRLAKQARTTLSRCDPEVIGITGSFGKTSTKHILGEMLQTTLGATFWTKGGINTTMGVTREIRTRMRPGYQFAVMEMGAYHEGSIDRLCKLTPPHAAIITAIGQTHIDRFGSQEAIVRAKSELVNAVPAGGIVVCNGDDVQAREIGALRDNTLYFGFSDGCDCRIVGYRLNHFTLIWNDKRYDIETQMVGKPAAMNLAAAFSMACTLGADPDFIANLIPALQAHSNRLQMRTVGGEITLHDGYNSNPTGFRAALETLDAISGKQKVLVTPGMIELGSNQAKENRVIAEIASQVCDRVLVVGHHNREALLEGLSDVNVDLCDSRDEAFAVLRQTRQKGDVVLIENDLPDLFEGRPKF